VDLAKENAELRARNTALEAEVENLRAQVSSLIGMMANMNAAAQKK
jgi:cell division protein FtsB